MVMIFGEWLTVREIESKISEYQSLLDMQHKRTQQADKAWQIAHNQLNVLPDLGELIEWLMSEAGMIMKGDSMKSVIIKNQHGEVMLKIIHHKNGVYESIKHQSLEDWQIDVRASSNSKVNFGVNLKCLKPT
jgi:hypothetical protein